MSINGCNLHHLLEITLITKLSGSKCLYVGVLPGLKVTFIYYALLTLKSPDEQTVLRINRFIPMSVGVCCFVLTQSPVFSVAVATEHFSPLNFFFDYSYFCMQ